MPRSLETLLEKHGVGDIFSSVVPRFYITESRVLRSTSSRNQITDTVEIKNHESVLLFHNIREI